MDTIVYREQKAVLDKLKSLKKPYKKVIGNQEITIFPQVYSAGSDSSLLYESVEINPGETALDLCTGTGIIALRLKELGAASVTAVDINPAAVRNAKFNSKNTKPRIDIKISDLFEAVADKSFDVITINPPFTNRRARDEVEKMFWDGGYRLITRFFQQLKYHLNVGGRAYLAWSSFGDEKLLYRLSKANGFDIEKIGTRLGKHNLSYYVYLIRYKDDPSKIFFKKNSKIKIYDLNQKYGDWLFKLPFLKAIEGGRVYQSKNYKIPISGFFDTRQKCDTGLFFTRTGQNIDGLLAMHMKAVEIRRISRYEEEVIIYEKGDIVLTKRFRNDLEQDRIKQMGNFLNIKIPETIQFDKKPLDKSIAIYLGASENENKRLEFDLKQIEEFIFRANREGFQITLIREKDKKGFDSRLSTKAKKDISIVETEEIMDALEIVEKNSYYFGSDSGLAHYAVRQGKIALVLYNSRYHTVKPLFNSDFWNHFTFFGDKRFVEEAVYYLRNSFGSRRLLSLYESIDQALATGNVFSKDLYSNEYKFFRMISSLTFSEEEFTTDANQKRSPIAIFEPDYVREVRYKNLKPKNEDFFSDTRRIICEIKDLLEQKLDSKEFYQTHVWAKNCSFTSNLSLKQGSSDIDFLTIKTPANIAKRKEIYYGILRIMGAHNLSTSLPHQLPIVGNNIKIPADVQLLIKNGKICYIESLPSDDKNLEKWKARIKVKIIFGNLSGKNLKKMKEMIGASPLLGKDFVEEIDGLIEEKDNFKKYREFLLKINSLISSADPFGRPVTFLVKFDGSEGKNLTDTLSGLMSHGIVYINKGLLYTIWDLRRPQHGWFIPVLIDLDSKTERKIISIAFRRRIFRASTFRDLKALHTHPSKEKILSALESNSFILTNEAFRKLSTVKRNIDFSKSELYRFAKNQKSNAEEGLDKKISLCGLAGCKLIPPKTSLSQLSKYNLYAYSINNLGKIDLEKTQFYKNKIRKAETINLIESNFYAHFTCLIREYCLYKFFGFKTLLEKKKIEILFNYFVRGKSLMEGPYTQSKSIEKFLRTVPITRIFSDDHYLKKTLLNLSEIKSDIGPADFLPKHIISRLIERQNRALKLTVPFSKIIMAQKGLNDRNWNSWKRTKSYRSLVKEEKFVGSLIVTLERKYPIFLFEENSDLFMIASEKCLQKFGTEYLRAERGWGILSPSEFHIVYSQNFKSSPFLSIHQYDERWKGDIYVNNRYWKVGSIIGEGNYSLVYKITAQKDEMAFKHSVIPLEGEFAVGSSLNKISPIFVKHIGFNKYDNGIACELAEGRTLAQTNKTLSNKNIKDIFYACDTAFRKGIGFGDITPNNVIISKKNSVRLIDPHFFFPIEMTLLKDILGILYLIYYNKHRKRFKEYWPIRSDIIAGRIKIADQLMDTLNSSTIDKSCIKKLGILVNKSL